MARIRLVPRKRELFVTEVSALAQRQAEVIQRVASKLSEAIFRLDGFEDSKRQLVELEDEGDRVARGRRSQRLPVDWIF